MQTMTVANAMWPSARKSPTSEPDPGRVLTQATLRAADVLDVPQRTLADIIGVSASTISRAANGGMAIDPETKAGELAKLFAGLARNDELRKSERRDLLVSALRHTENGADASVLLGEIQAMR